MPGTNAGTGHPLSLKCSQCKLSRTAIGGAMRGDLERTGRTKPYKPRGQVLRRSSRVSYECRCKVCGHVGWYAHTDAPRKPLMRSAGHGESVP